MKSRIGKKLWLSYCVLVVITLFIAGALLNPLFKNYLIMAKKKEMLQQANEVVSLTQRYTEREIDEASFMRILDNLNAFYSTRIMIIDREGSIVAPSRVRPPVGRRFGGMKGPQRGMRLSQEEVGQVLSGKTVMKEGLSPHFNLPVISVAVPITSISREGVKEVSGAVLSFSPVYLVTDTVKKAYYYLGISSIIAIFLAMGIAYYFSRKISLPLKNMNEAALVMAQGQYQTVITPTSNDELGELATSMNYLAQQLDVNVTALEQGKRKLESIVSSINEGLVAIDQEGRIILVNPVLEKLFMNTSKNILGKRLAEVSPFPELVSSCEEALSQEEIVARTFKLAHTTYKVIVSPIKQEQGQLLGVVGVLQDISEMEKVEQMRHDFISNVSHELRTPITVIRGFTDCLLDGVTQQSPAYYYGIIRDETLRLERLINNIMELSLLQSGKVELDLAEVDLTSLVQATVNKFLLKAKAQKVELSLQLDFNHKVTVFCDADRIEQILVIFLDNALKFTPAGGTVEVNLQEDIDKGKVYLSIKDSGIGIPAEELPYIWERFYKVDKSRNRQKEDGTGLGLFIAKQIADLHQAKIRVESTLQQGSTFTLEFKSM